MDKLIQMVKEELKNVEKQGFNTSNLETTYKLVDIAKDLYEIKEKEKEEEGGKMKGYQEGGYSGYSGYGRQGGGRGGYSAGGYSNYEEGYGRRGVPGSGRGRGYRGETQMKEHLERILDGAEMYEYGKESYMYGGDSERIFEGLEKLMYGICMFVESAMDFAETPQEKEIIKKHIQKMKSM